MKGYIQIYTGNGKGKTTAALGLALRALGHQKKVCLIQFMKKGDFGEIKALRKFPNILIKQFGTKSFIRKEKIKPLDRKKAKQALIFSQDTLLKSHYDIVILDEIVVAIYFGLIDEKQLIKLIKSKPKKVELILTGRNCSAKLKNMADLVTEMKEIKHYYHRGIKARSGIEY